MAQKVCVQSFHQLLGTAALTMSVLCHLAIVTGTTNVAQTCSTYDAAHHHMLSLILSKQVLGLSTAATQIAAWETNLSISFGAAQMTCCPF